MSLEISFTDFRGFHSQRFVPIAPLTLLVGENSAGKTSFLAGLKFVGDMFNNSDPADFNAEPFQLGTFEQIAHNRGGRAGRAKRFSIAVRKRISGESRVKYSTLRISFVPQEVGASVNLVEFSSRTGRITFRISETNPSVVLEDISKKLEWEADDGLLSLLAADFRGSISFIVNNLMLLFRNKKDDLPDWWSEFMMDYSELQNELRRPQSATSAIRTKPLRTYTPGIDEEDGEGSHVPYEMAKLARRRDKTDWQNLKDQLETFGSNSEMFTEIDVKSFGKTMSDPFQIQVGHSGPKRNIVDLGYGLSQVLPILYGSMSVENNKRFLIQQPEVHLHPKAQAALGQFFIDKMKASEQTFVLETHSDFMIDRARMAIANENISQSEVSILFFSRGKLENSIHPIRLDAAGDPVSPPNGYRSFFVDEQLRLLGV